MLNLVPSGSPAVGEKHGQKFSLPAAAMSVSVIIPVLNEEASLPHVLSKLLSVMEVIIVDGLSKDRSIDVALEVRPDCRIVLERKKGKGAAVRAGLSAISGNYVVLLDADCSHDPSEIRRIIEILDDGYDLAHGSRFMPGGGSVDLTLVRLVGNKLFVWLTNLLHGTSYTDVCYGYMGFRREALARLSLEAESMEIDADILIAARKAGLRIAEFPSFERRRYAGRSRLNALQDGWRILRKIVGDSLST